MFAGVGIYLMFHYIPLLSPLKVLAKGAEDYVMPLKVFIQLFTTFCKVNPREMRICSWHAVWRWRYPYIFPRISSTVSWSRELWSA